MLGNRVWATFFTSVHNTDTEIDHKTCDIGNNRSRLRYDATQPIEHSKMSSILSFVGQ